MLDAAGIYRVLVYKADGNQQRKIAHAMRNAREGHSVTYLQSKEVLAGIHVRRAVVGYGGRDGGCCR